jgi:tetratricopeptide (TPR) repeat protein
MPSWTKNRVVLGLAVFFAAMAVWEFRLKPQFRPMYERGIVLYQHGRYEEALREFDRAYQVAPNAVEVIVMMGWSNLKLRRYEEAGFYFQRAQRLDPRNDEAQLGGAFVAWHGGQRLDVKKIEKLGGRYTDDADVRALVAAARAQRQQSD